MDHVRISFYEPTSVTQSPRKYIKMLRIEMWCLSTATTRWSQARLCVTGKPTKLQFEFLNVEHFYALEKLRINRSKPQNLDTCALGDLWSTSSDTNQVIQIQIQILRLLDKDQER